MDYSTWVQRVTKGDAWIDPADYAGPVMYPYGKKHVPPEEREDGWEAWLKERAL